MAEPLYQFLSLSAIPRPAPLLARFLAAWLPRLSPRAARLDRGRYYVEASPLLGDLLEGKSSLASVLAQLESLREQLLLEFEQRWTSYLRALENLAEGIDIDEALRYSSEMRAELEQRVEQVHALAQLGIVVEIIGHELNELDGEIARNMRRLPRAVQATEPFKSAMTAQRKLVDQLRFLAPMQLSGRRLREEITGEQIFEYVQSFFANVLEAKKVAFTATKEFRSLRVVEFPSRLQPVFINLVNNALFWVSQRKEQAAREIRLAVVDDSVVVADSGPGVDADDIPRLFQLFFSRKAEGRGVGLYLCRMNLEMGGHSISYASETRYRVLGGANFVIRFNGLQLG